MTMTATKTKKRVLPSNHKTVAGILREGKTNATLMSDIMSIAGINDRRQMYQIIEELIVKYGYCIAGSKKGEYKGYYIISNKGELIETLNSLNSTIQSMMTRHKKLQENFKGD